MWTTYSLSKQDGTREYGIQRAARGKMERKEVVTLEKGAKLKARHQKTLDSALAAANKPIASRKPAKPKRNPSGGLPLTKIEEGA